MQPERPPIDARSLAEAARGARPVAALLLALLHRLSTVCRGCETALARATSRSEERPLTLVRLYIVAHQIDRSQGHRDAAPDMRLGGSDVDFLCWWMDERGGGTSRLSDTKRAPEPVPAREHLTEAEVDRARQGRFLPRDLVIRTAAHLREVDPPSRAALDALLAGLSEPEARAARPGARSTSSAG